MNDLLEIYPEYIYITIPPDYICVYHKLMMLLADYGEDMLKDCKAKCGDKNSDVIDCYNMFNAAIAARKIGKDKLAETIIKYVKAKLNQYNVENKSSIVFPVDADGELKMIISCINDNIHFYINPDDGNLYEKYIEDIKKVQSSVYKIDNNNLIKIDTNNE